MAPLDRDTEGRPVSWWWAVAEPFAYGSAASHAYAWAEVDAHLAESC